MIQDKISQRKRIVLLDNVLEILTKEEATRLACDVQNFFPGKLQVLPIANKYHLNSVCKSPQEIYLLIIGRETPTEFDSKKLSYLISQSKYYHFLRNWSMESINHYSEKISKVLGQSKFKIY